MSATHQLETVNFHGYDSAELLAVNEAYDSLLSRIAELFELANKCKMLELKKMLGSKDGLPEKQIEFLLKVHLCIEASGSDSRVIEICKAAASRAAFRGHDYSIGSNGRLTIRRVYFARNSAGLIKIGSSIDAKSRVRALSNGAGQGLELIAECVGTYALEMQLHEEFKELRRHGEWFEPSDALARKIEELCELSRRAQLLLGF